MFRDVCHCNCHCDAASGESLKLDGPHKTNDGHGWRLGVCVCVCIFPTGFGETRLATAGLNDAVLSE